MAISSTTAILKLLKTYYKKEGVQNLLFRNSPLLKKIAKDRVEGKTQNFAAMYGRGGACTGDFTAAKALASTVSQNVEFEVQPGQLFSVYSMNAKEALAARTNAGGYIKVGAAKMFAASESLRKTLAAALYGSGYGELCAAPTTAMTANTAVDITLPEDAIMKIDVGSKLVIKATKATAESSATNVLTVNTINGTTVNVTPESTATASSGYVLCLAGSTNGTSPLLPVGLDGWLPVTKKRSGAGWNSYIGTSFFGVDRSVCADRLAGAFYDATGASSAATQKKSYAVMQLIKKLRRQGSQCDLIVMNDSDFMDFSNEIETTNTFFTQTSTKESKKASIGFSDVSASFSTNYIENIIDDPYCVAGRFYILSSEAVAFWAYTNTDKVSDGIEGNNAGKVDPINGEEDKSTDPMQLLADDLFSVTGGNDTFEGPATLVTLNLFGSFVVTNPSVCGVGEFYGSTDFAAA